MHVYCRSNRLNCKVAIQPLHSVERRGRLEVMDWLYTFIAVSTDATILGVGVAIAASAALVIALLSRRLLFHPNDRFMEDHGKLAEVVHNSLLAFSVFILALVLTEVRSNLGRADDMELREASIIARLVRDLAALKTDTSTASVARVRDYVKSAVESEWKTLARHQPALSADTDRALTALVAQVYAAADESPSSADTLRGYIERLEDARQTRLESATRTVPAVFWWVMGVFIIGGMIMNGRHKLDAFGLSLIAFHMGAVGLVVALILVMDSPFRGETSVSTAALTRAAGLSAPAGP
jgi:hypothetical protein